MIAPHSTPEPLLVHVSTAAAMLGVCPRTVYSLIAQGHIPLRHIGRAARVSTEDLRKYVASISAQREAQK
jgi:excisionase family DNA binding protein